jgi:hypothetical protein
LGILLTETRANWLTFKKVGIIMAKTNTTAASKTNAAADAASANKGPEVVTTATADNKAAKARAIFDACYAMNPVPQRKDIIARAVNEAGLTPAGAATYLQNYKSKKGLVKKTAPAA